MIFVIETDADKFLRTHDRCMECDVRRLKEKALNSARRTCQFLKLFCQYSQTVPNLKYLFDGEHNAWELEKIVTDSFSDIEPSVTEGASEAYQTRRVFS